MVVPNAADTPPDTAPIPAQVTIAALDRRRAPVHEFVAKSSEAPAPKYAPSRLALAIFNQSMIISFRLGL